MRARADITAVGDGWQVDLRAADGRALAPAHLLRRCPPKAGLIFPQPADGAGGGLAATDDVVVIARALRAVAEPRPDAAQVKAVGDYLGATLLSAAGWQALRDQNVSDLTLAWASATAPFDGLPWELARRDAGFAFADVAHPLSVTREVAAPPGPATIGLVLPLRLLFVVTASLDDPQVRAGTEFLGLLARLRGRDLPLRERVLLDATPQALTDALAEFQPQVVHFVGHGVQGATGPALRFAAERTGDAPTDLGADALCALLATGGPPPVVVLNACHSGASGAADTSSPLAARAVQAGARAAVGMGGRVGDSTCRLFARLFYEALLTGGDVRAAVAQARRMALVHGGLDPQAGADWARPARFPARDCTGAVEVTGSDALPANAARRLRTFDNPAIFCDRLPLMGDLLSQVRTGRRLDGVGGKRPVVVLHDAETPPQNRRLGRSRVLDEVAQRALGDGFAPIVRVYRDAMAMRPGSVAEAGAALFDALLNTWDAFGLPELADSAYEKLLDGHLDQLPLNVRRRARGVTEPAEHWPTLAAALSIDLARLATATGRRPLWVLDDLDRWGQAGVALLDALATGDDLGRVDEVPVPVVLAGNLYPRATEHAPAAAALKRLAESPHAHALALSPIEGEPSRRLAMQQVLLAWQPPYVPAPEKDSDVFKAFEHVVGGYPSNLERAVLDQAITICSLLGALVPADDDALLRQQAAGR
ncbi:MAG: CHAT domain-containing protein [Myxococcales bacterium]|nr:CHAT domain-containing protein [Myxococcales bacterium]